VSEKGVCRKRIYEKEQGQSVLFIIKDRLKIVLIVRNLEYLFILINHDQLTRWKMTQKEWQQSQEVNALFREQTASPSIERCKFSYVF
jgi:hypothetical protein